jgi:hypothetical protein
VLDAGRAVIAIPPEHAKTRAIMLALRRGFGLVRIDRVIYLVDRDGLMRELVRAERRERAWWTALEVLEREGTE